MKIKIAQILEATIGGTAKHINQIFDNLNSHEFEFTLICSTKRDLQFTKNVKNLQKRGIHVIIIEMVRNINPIIDFLAVVKLVKILKEGKFQVVHCHSSKAGFVGRIAAAVVRVPNVIYTPHAFVFHAYENKWPRRLFIFVERILAKITNQIVCVSRSELCAAQTHKIIPRGSLILIANAVDVYEKIASYCNINIYNSELSISCSDFIIGTVGFFRRQKGLHYFIDAVSEFARTKQNVKAIIIGRGSEEPILVDHIRKNNMQNEIKIFNNIANTEPCYRMMDIFISTSLWEGMSYSILEAMASKTPVIATDIPGIRDVIKNEENGILVPPKDVENLARSISRMYEDLALREKLGRNALRSVIKRHNLRAWTTQMHRLYSNQMLL